MKCPYCKKEIDEDLVKTKESEHYIKLYKDVMKELGMLRTIIVKTPVSKFRLPESGMDEDDCPIYLKT